MKPLHPRLLLPLAALISGCLTLDPFVFGNEPLDGYGWDDDPCDPELQGELVEAEHRLSGGPAPSCHPSLVPPEDRTEGFVELPDGTEIHYVFAHREDAPATIVYSHGTGQNIGRYWDRVELLWAMGFHVLIYDYPGYGRSGGEPDEAGVLASATAVVEEALPQMPGVDLGSVFFYGYSLGSGPTYELAWRASEGELSVMPRGVISEAAFCSIEALVQDGARLDLPGSFLSDIRFDNCTKIGRLDPELPVMIIHGTRDDFIVPVHAKMLEDAAVGDEVSLQWIDGADHSEIPVAGPQRYEALMRDFVDEHLPPQ